MMKVIHKFSQKGFRKKVWWGIISTVLFIPSVLFAQPVGGGTSGGSGSATRFPNPFRFKTINELLRNILDLVLQIAVPVIAIMIIYSGLKFVMSRGNDKELGEAKKRFFATIIGAAVILGAWVILRVLQGTVTELSR